MIYVRRNSSLIPADLLAKAVDAQKQLEALPEDKRADFIKSKGDIWRSFKECLSHMSYGKCWYSEMPVDQTFHDVDHFRPKLVARRAEAEADRGYEWLAFSWENFRVAAQRSNRLSTNEDTDETEGKSDWFPLLEGSPRASWNNRCEDDERPMLLDPVKRQDVELIVVQGDGWMGPSRFCHGTNRTRVEITVRLLGLNLPNLTAARKRVMRDVRDAADILLRTLEQASQSNHYANVSPIDRMTDALRTKTAPQEPYSAAARAQLRLMGLAELCLAPEEAGT